MFHRFADASTTKPAKSAPCHCTRCGGGGRVASPVEAGICFRCRGAGVDPTVRDWRFPAGWTDEQCSEWLTAKHDAKVAKRRAEADAVWQANVEACPVLVEFEAALRFEVGGVPKSQWPDVVRHWTAWEAGFASDLTSKARRYRLSEKQIATLASIREKVTERAAKAAIEADTAVAVEPGRREISGEVVSVKVYTGDYGRYYGRDVTSTKILVRCEGYKLFGTAPASIAGDVAKGDHVTLTATVKPKEIGFGTFSRPTNATLTKPVSA